MKTVTLTHLADYADTAAGGADVVKVERSGDVLTIQARLNVTTDVDAGSDSTPVCIGVNGAEVGRFMLSAVWQQLRVAVPRAQLRLGVNRVEIRWPEQLVGGDEALERIANRTEKKLGPARFPPVFSAFHSLEATLLEDL